MRRYLHGWLARGMDTHCLKPVLRQVSRSYILERLVGTEQRQPVCEDTAFLIVFDGGGEIVAVGVAVPVVCLLDLLLPPFSLRKQGFDVLILHVVEVRRGCECLDDCCVGVDGKAVILRSSMPYVA